MLHTILQPIPFFDVLVTLNCNISLHGPRELSELNAVKHFQVHLGKELAGAFSDEVWCHILPRVAQHEPSIWYAMTAIGMLDASSRLNLPGDTSIAIKQYGRAIRELKKRLDSRVDVRHQDVVLLSCILLAIFECLQNNIRSALRHIGCGMTLLVGWEQLDSSPETPTGYLSRKTLLPIFLSLDTQAIQMGAIDFRNHGVLLSYETGPSESAAFATTEEAYLSLNHIFNQLTHWSVWMEAGAQLGKKPSQEWMVSEAQRLWSRFERWDTAFAPLTQQQRPIPAIFLLSAQRKVLQAFFSKQTDGPDTELEWDKHLALFQGAIEDAETYLSLSHRLHPPFRPSVMTTGERPQSPRPMFTVSMDIVMSLFVISTKCRDAELRRRALTMLRTYNRKEGIWDSYLCSLVVGKIIELEESTALEDGFIPEFARIFEIDVNLNEESVSAITFKRRVKDVTSGCCVEVADTLAW